MLGNVIMCVRYAILKLPDALAVKPCDLSVPRCILKVTRCTYLSYMIQSRCTTESTTSASYLDVLLSIGRDGQLRSTTNEMISISTSQTFRSWVVIFHLRQPMEFLSLNLYDTPGLAPRMNVLYWGPGDFPVSYSNRDTSRNVWNRHSGSFMVDMGILFSNMKYPSHEC